MTHFINISMLSGAQSHQKTVRKKLFNSHPEYHRALAELKHALHSCTAKQDKASQPVTIPNKNNLPVGKSVYEF